MNTLDDTWIITPKTKGLCITKCVLATQELYNASRSNPRDVTKEGII